MVADPLLSVVIPRREGPPSVRFHLSTEFIEESSREGASRARNSGAARAHGEWLLFLDDDCRLGDSTVQRLTISMKFGEFTSNTIYGALYKPAQGGVWSRAYGWIQRSWVLLSQGSSGGVRNLLGGFLLISRSAYQSLGGMDESIPWAGEETEFLRRASASGFRLQLLPGLEVEHNNSLDIFAYLRRAWMQGWRKGERRLETQGLTIARVWTRRHELDPLSVSEMVAVGVFLGVMVFASVLAKVRSQLLAL